MKITPIGLTSNKSLICERVKLQDNLYIKIYINIQVNLQLMATVKFLKFYMLPFTRVLHQNVKELMSKYSLYFIITL